MFAKMESHSNSGCSSLLIKQEVLGQDKQNFTCEHLCNGFMALPSHNITIKSEFYGSSENEENERKPNAVKLELSFPETFVDHLREDIPDSLEESLEVSLEEMDDDLNKELTDKESLAVPLEEVEKLNRDLTISEIENETTFYKCPMCEEVFKLLNEFKDHKKMHYLEKKTCKICNQVLQNSGKLEEHVNKHLGRKPYRCEECGSTFISPHYLKLHKKCHSTRADFLCKLCPKSFRTKSSLRCHQVVHAEKKDDFRCKVCSFDCEDATVYKTHMSDHGKKSEIQCSLCNKTFNTDKGLEAHLSSHEELNFPCEYCGKIFPTMYRIKRHVKRAHIANKCEHCNEIFYDKATFTKHQKLHEIEKQHECEFCQKVFDKAKNLSEHIRLQHRQDGEMKKCEVCGKEFINNSLLKNHAKTHDKTFKCIHCEKVFSSRSNLEIHSVTHSGAKNYKCEICNKQLSSKTSLKNHLASHSEERQFQCEICTKAFKTNRRLYVHKMCHATEEKFQCEICLQKFRLKQYLKFHMNKHSKVKPFECHVCKKRFKHKKSRDKHVIIGKHRVVTDEEHDCDFCDETFPTRDILIDHFAKVHHQENVINSSIECEDEYVAMEEDERDDGDNNFIDNLCLQERVS